MNYVKKLFREKINLILLILFLISVTIALILLQIRNSEKLYFLTIPDNHSVIVNGDEDLKLYVKCSRQDTMYMNKDMIDSVYFLDYVTKDTYQVELKNVNYVDLFKYENDNYFNYELTLNIPFTSSKQVEFKNFYLIINYLNDEVLNFKMGSLSLFSSETEENNILIQRLKGIVNLVNEKEYLVGVLFDLKALKDNITIIDIQAISPIVKMNLGYLKEMDDIEIDNTENLETLLDKEYNMYIDYLDYDISIDLDSNKKLLIPLYYKENLNVKTLGFIIDYLDNGIYKQQIVYPFKFFETGENSTVEKIEYDFN